MSGDRLESQWRPRRVALIVPSFLVVFGVMCAGTGAGTTTATAGAEPDGSFDVVVSFVSPFPDQVPEATEVAVQLSTTEPETVVAGPLTCVGLTPCATMRVPPGNYRLGIISDGFLYSDGASVTGVEFDVAVVDADVSIELIALLLAPPPTTAAPSPDTSEPAPPEPSGDVVLPVTGSEGPLMSWALLLVVAGTVLWRLGGRRHSERPGT